MENQGRVLNTQRTVCSQASGEVEGGMTIKAQIRAERVRWKVENERGDASLVDLNVKPSPWIKMICK